ncbi:hypothetical protein GPECTOR_153g59 [Gonium pectorale]|uniref:Uncharacterized protein n=1 Tax=Gonium pectorale TaxID=33097 RepID=A0A150FXR0_GONPE|nr:hypothetical protein GPECTOR_153g59 [Gonium pectorale]|eukprot:KXZ42386.1 hypothetical protein GPECTOR_153g59 [Gonium pectorale]
MLDRLNEAPKLGSRFEHYHRDMRDSLIAKATQWLQAQPGQAEATLYGDQLAKYYMEQLQLHFEPEKKADYRQRYARLTQSNVAPTAYLQEAARVCFIRNPELAPPNYKAPAGVLQAAFDNNLAAYHERQGAQPA